MHEKPVEAHESVLYHSKKEATIIPQAHSVLAFHKRFTTFLTARISLAFQRRFSLADRSSFICIPFPSAVSSSKGVEELQKRKHTLSFFAVHSCKLDFGLQVHTFTS